MTKVLVIIDNIQQYDRIKSLVELKGRTDVEFIYKHSPVKSGIWEHEDFIAKADSVINVKTQISEILQEYNLVISIHCFQFFPEELVNNIRCINVHPGYNPLNRGWYPQVFAIVHNLVIGATIHEIDNKLDNGPIIARDFVEIYDWDTSYTIYNRVLDKEMELLDLHFNSIIDGTYDRIRPESKGNLFKKKDFHALCKLDMKEKGTFEDFYNRLRALTHGEYKNAYFINSEGHKVYLSLNIEIEKS